MKYSIFATSIVLLWIAIPRLEKSCDRRKASRERKRGVKTAHDLGEGSNYIGKVVSLPSERTSECAGLTGSQILPGTEIDSTSPLAAVTLYLHHFTSHGSL